MKEHVQHSGRSVFKRIWLFIRLTVRSFHRAIKRFVKVRASESAATITFFTIFSLFPLLLALVFVGSFVLEQDVVQTMINDTINEFIPIAQDVVIHNMEAVLAKRQSAGLVAVISLLWSGSTAFYNLVLNINRAWEDANLRNFITRRLLALGIIGLLLLLMVLSTIGGAALDLIAAYQFPFINLSLNRIGLWQTVLDLIPFAFKVMIFFGLYWLIPNTRVRRRDALWGAIFAVTTIQLTSTGFRWLLKNGFVNYELIYGSLSAIITVMMWIYITVIIILFGAHLSAAVLKVRKDEEILQNSD